MMTNGESNYTQKSSIRPNNAQYSLLKKLMIGSMMGASDLLVCMSFSAFLFTNAAPTYVYFFTVIILFGAALQRILLSYLSKINSILTAPHVSILPFMAIMVTAIFSQVPHSSPSEMLSTSLIMFPIITISLGICFVIISYFKFGKISQYIPVPVEIGFIVGIGWLLVNYSINSLCQVPASSTNFSMYFEYENVIRYLPALVLGITLLIAGIVFKNKILIEIITISTVAISICVFYLSFWALNIPLAEARNSGFLFQLSDRIDFSEVLKLFNLGKVHWHIVMEQIPNIAIIILITLITTLLNNAGIGLLTQQDINFNEELKKSGYVNLFSGFLFGLPGVSSLVLTSINNEFCPENRLIMMISVIFLGIGIYYNTSILGFIPKQIIFGFLIYLGLSVFSKWILTFRKKLLLIENTLIAFILFVCVYFGIVYGLLFGITISVIIFLINFSKIPIIKFNLTGNQIQSNCQYNPTAKKILHDNGDQILVYKLQNYIFFGTAYKLYSNIKYAVQSQEKIKPRFILLDFSLVPDIDTSVLFCFSSTLTLLRTLNIKLIFTSINETIQKKLKFTEEDTSEVRQFTSMDEGLEWCEKEILMTSGYKEPDLITLASFLESNIENSEISSILLKYFDSQEISAGVYLFEKNDIADALYYIESGRISVWSNSNKNQIRMRVLNPGVFIGEMAFFTHDELRSTSVFCEKNCLLKKLTYLNYHRLENENPTCALMLQKIITHTLSDRISHANDLIRYFS